MENQIPNRDDEYKFYQELWEFIVNYENVIKTVKNWIVFMMHCFSNDPKYQSCLNILLTEMPSDQLMHKFWALILVFSEDTTPHKAKIDSCISAILELNELRNNLIHRHYSMWYGEGLHIASSNPKTRKNWLNHNFIEWDNFHLETVNNYIKDLNMLLIWIRTLLTRWSLLKPFVEYQEDKIANMRTEFKKYTKR